MHEMSLVRPVLDYVLQKGEECGARAVLSVRLTIGDAHDVVEELIPGLLRHLARGTIAENAEVVIEHVPITARCNRCAEVFPLDLYREETWTCRRCGAHKDYQMAMGREFYIDDIRVLGPAPVVAGRVG